MFAIAFAGIAAVLYGLSAALQQKEAAAVPTEVAGRPSIVVSLLRRRLWLLGMAVELVGFAAHAAALQAGSLVVVQVVSAASLAVSVTLAAAWSGRRLDRRQRLAVGAVVVGVGAFAWAMAGSDAGCASGGAGAAIAAAVAAAATVPVALAGLASCGRARAVLLGVAAGLADCCMSVATMVFAHAVGHGPGAVFTSWGTYALVVVGAGSLILTQSAFQAGRPTVTLPIITVITPVFSALVGTCFLGESTGLGALSIAGAVAAAALAAAGLVTLARRPDEPAAAEDPIVQAVPASAPPTPVRPAAETEGSGSAADAALVIAQLWARPPCQSGVVMM